MTDSDLRKLEALEAAASPAPWQPCPEKMFIFTAGDTAMIASTDADDDSSLVIRGSGARLPMDENHDLIIAARNALPLLIAEVRRLRMPAEVAETIRGAIAFSDDADDDRGGYERGRAALAWLDTIEGGQ